MSSRQFKHKDFNGSRYDVKFNHTICENCGYTFGEGHSGLICTRSPKPGYPKKSEVTFQDVLDAQGEWEWFCPHCEHGIEDGKGCDEDGCENDYILINQVIYRHGGNEDFKVGDIFLYDESLYQVTSVEDRELSALILAICEDSEEDVGDEFDFDIEALKSSYPYYYCLTQVYPIPVPVSTQVQQSTMKEESTMSTVLVSTNISAAKAAALNEAGRIANGQLTKIVAKSAPLMIKGYIETPFGQILIANLFRMAVQQFKPDSSKAALLSEAMMSQAYQELLKSFNIEDMLEEFLADNKISKALTKATAPEPAKGKTE